ncbi:conserved hypothetical protein [Leishmania mexicana MHOM/GT/2001/U1103]|uniref:Mitochondrial glycoprotein-like protein n=1 Tax=Leishmania mexicana (strain MHOM/GT/2001/U1103) TaxID=929439 RepID=E9AKI5_LEIMU|nr:conserved hypothetical protein [Leishmania mexicana MHOM/GT/2001/U1103]CBZ23436.1 conserved hypothetical protein [Leishmania mexicana MHOM/GT/2001/U1103]
MLRRTLPCCTAAPLRYAASPLCFPRSRRGVGPAFSSSNGLSHMTRAYATTTPPSAGNHHDAADEDAHMMGGGDVDAAAPHRHHAPTLRSALPPSATELPEESFLKSIDKEILDEKVRLDKGDGPPSVPMGWTMHHTEGTSFIYGRRLWMPPPPSSSSSSSSSSMWRGEAEARRGDAADSSTQESRAGEQQQEREVKPGPRATMERHFLRIQLTSRDASLDPECDVRGEHFPFSFFVQRVLPEEGEEGCGAGVTGRSSGEQGTAANSQDVLHGDSFEEHTFYHNSIEARCDVVDGELIVDGLVYHGPPPPTSHPPSSSGAPQPRYTNPFGSYPGPNLDEVEEEVLDGIQSWLAERGVDDQLGEFVGQYSIWVEQAEYERWLQQLRDYVAA